MTNPPPRRRRKRNPRESWSSSRGRRRSTGRRKAAMNGCWLVPVSSPLVRHRPLWASTTFARPSGSSGTSSPDWISLRVCRKLFSRRPGTRRGRRTWPRCRLRRTSGGVPRARVAKVARRRQRDGRIRLGVSASRGRRNPKLLRRARVLDRCRRPWCTATRTSRSHAITTRRRRVRSCMSSVSRFTTMYPGSVPHPTASPTTVRCSRLNAPTAGRCCQT
mmetsp:Transcript_4855/g.21944  ORF Transcript_4855/g.21944 Transcript_4855/m.21944 type:complete len:219 (+) Transcript_4855:335-991(+)